mmetsp:Transcript_24620/g.63078  ORF Transcript_24620/g.63078 Transcript_24620/m.63078 type:complete len:119 (-) Transcript_24620:948-1304(-)
MAWRSGVSATSGSNWTDRSRDSERTQQDVKHKRPKNARLKALATLPSAAISTGTSSCFYTQHTTSATPQHLRQPHPVLRVHVHALAGAATGAGALCDLLLACHAAGLHVTAGQTQRPQ